MLPTLPSLLALVLVLDASTMLTLRSFFFFLQYAFCEGSNESKKKKASEEPNHRV
jgi:hypothetical protein